MSKFQAQKALKPKAEDAARVCFEEDKLENILDFLDFLKVNKLTPRWYSTDSWVVKYKNKKVCQIKFNWIPRPSDKENFFRTVATDRKKAAKPPPYHKNLHHAPPKPIGR